MLGIRTRPHGRPCNKKGQCRKGHWPVNPARIGLVSLVLFLRRRIFVFRRSGLFFRLGSGSAVGWFRCALSWGTRLRSTCFGCALVSSRLGSRLAGRVRFGSGTRLLCFWRAFLGSTCPGSGLFGSGFMRSWRRLAGRMRLWSWTRLLRFWCILFWSSLVRSGLGFAGRMRLGGRMRLFSFRCALRAWRSFVSRAFLA